MTDPHEARVSAGPDLRGVASAFRRAIADGLMCAATDDLVADAPRVIAEAVNADLVLITRLHRHAGILETVSCYDVYGRVSSFAYDMRGTPCEVVVSMGAPVSFAKALQRTFPDDADLRTLDLHAYSGTPLLDENGEVLGVVCVLWSLERPDAAAVASALADLAPRLARETQRRLDRDAHAVWERAAAHGLWRFDLRSATMTYTPTALTLLGKTGASSFATTNPDAPFEWLPSDDDAIATALRATVRDGAPLDLVCPSPPGAPARWLRLVGCAQRGPTGAVELVAGSISDVTELVDARRAAAAAREAQSAFLANMSHEMRTPLNGVVALADLLAASPLDERRREMVEMIRASGQMLERLVNDALDLAKIEAGKVELALAPFDIAAAVTAAAHPSRIVAERKGLEFVVSLGAGATGALLGDELRWRQIIANLVSNAVKFTPAGRVELAVDIVGAGDAAELRIDVVDTGPGFERADADRLFKRFEQGGDRQVGGAGLGLTITRALVELMGGVISADATPGAGARFCVRAPAVRVEAPQLDAPPAQPYAEWSRPPRILLAEDNPATQRVMELVLEAIGASVHIVSDGAQAVQAFGDESFDLVLMDMSMPVLDGLAATRAIRAAEHALGRAPTPILMLTANALPDHVESARAAGCDAHIAKPVSPARVLDAIAQRLAVRAA
ncbi:MAG: response regulator [Alphaproteobacteria bacterium]|nr:response regulator [Alphaproteobacteria bacterium]